MLRDPERTPYRPRSMENTLPDTDTLRIDQSKPHWWRRLTDCDPISLEPLRRLKVEPFELSADGIRSYFFDGRVLSSYLVSTGTFAHPISRRELTRDDCQRLDAHIKRCAVPRRGSSSTLSHKCENTPHTLGFASEKHALSTLSTTKKTTKRRIRRRIRFGELEMLEMDL